MKKFFKGIVALLLIGIIGTIVYFMLPWIMITMYSGSVSVPDITYGEFPFKLVYELNGKNISIEDTIICKYDGTISMGAGGTKHKWKLWFKSGREQITLLDLNQSMNIDRWGHHILEILYYPGNAEYYMDDELEYDKRQGDTADSLSYMFKTEDGSIGFSAFSADELWQKYKIRLISWNVAKPIQNNWVEAKR